jgi:hypothetical protein
VGVNFTITKCQRNFLGTHLTRHLLRNGVIVSHEFEQLGSLKRVNLRITDLEKDFFDGCLYQVQGVRADPIFENAHGAPV